MNKRRNNPKQRKVVIGLGNPGDEYQNTRHNSGFMYIDYLLGKDLKGDGFQGKKLRHCVVYSVEDDLILVKPQTFMNNSGEAVKEVVKWLGVDIEKELILVHDDLDIPLGKYKFQFEKSPRDHNGVKSVEDHLGTVKFYRLRIGVDNRGGKNIDGEKYVLERFSEEELVQLREVFDAMDEMDFN
jgi:PTH1 family peptidyl-tRNA hydrolase